jgi:outer membrane protein insertion porin family
VQGPFLEVRVEGTTTFADIVRTIVAARRGTQAERVDLEAERNRVYALGTFEEVSVTLEDRGAGPVLIVRVRENPAVAAVEVVGATLLDADRLRDAVVAEHLLDPGRTLNALRAEQAVGTLRAIYRSVGLPYDVDVTLDVVTETGVPPVNGRTPVRLRYTLDESAPLRRVVFEPSSVLSESELETIFRGMTEDDGFDFAAYRAAVDAVAARYTQAGLRQSGIDLERTTLENGQLTVRFRELRIASFDTVALGIDASALSLRVGDLFDYDRCSTTSGGSPSAAPPTSGSRRCHRAGAVRVRFAVGAPDTAGPIDRWSSRATPASTTRRCWRASRSAWATPSRRRWPTRTSAASAPPTTRSASSSTRGRPTTTSTAPTCSG